MSNLIQILASIKHPHNKFIERLDLIKGYSETEIREIEQRYNLSIHGQFKDFLMTMGKCSGGLLFGDEIFIYNNNHLPTDEYFGKSVQQDWQSSYDLEEIIEENQLDFVEKQLFHFAGLNDHCTQYMLFTKNQDDIIYRLSENFDEISKTSKPKLEKFGTLFDFLKFYRKFTIYNISGNENPHIFLELTTGRLL